MMKNLVDILKFIICLLEILQHHLKQLRKLWLASCLKNHEAHYCQPSDYQQEIGVVTGNWGLWCFRWGFSS
ncbi:hypothetical protein A4A49_43502 [Nicotiana attenuata]|uniref:Uncharacterized protein n=1 Tax=Nicotiana attenuata TaxID=49451 RepID=A0A1J6JLU0_NICAT|nr:hypothetical protein A4A49_43502 [Nicotiana attenuata]